MSSRSLGPAMALVAMGSLGCNLIFGIEPGTLGGGSAGGAGAGSEGGAPPTTGGAGGVSNNGGEGGGVGGGGGSPPVEGCDPLLLGAGEKLGERCGLFVDASAPDGGDGSRANPFNQAADAFNMHDANGAIFICGSTVFTSYFELSGGGSVYGGLTCEWTADPTLIPTLMGAGSAEEAMLIRGSVSDTALIDHLHIRGVNAGQGRSSFGLVIDRVQTTIQDSVIESGTAGDGMTPVPGNPGATGANGSSPGACNNVAGGAGGANTCGVVAVNGGQGAVCSSAAGNFGFPGLGMGAGNGGGPGSVGGAPCSAGSQGQAGGGAGPGAAAGPIGLLDANGYSAGGAAQASAGAPGGGGGGGGSRPGGNGGGGGSGGCGGDGGQGGTSGSASFALVVLSGGLSLENVTLMPGRGGNGGNGTAGLSGGAGGSGAAGSPTTGCAGALGGTGGRGGPGGAGSGGPSAAIASAGDSSISVGLGTTVVPGSSGGAPGSPGQNPTISGPNGSMGVVCARINWVGVEFDCFPTLL